MDGLQSAHGAGSQRVQQAFVGAGQHFAVLYVGQALGEVPDVSGQQDFVAIGDWDWRGLTALEQSGSLANPERRQIPLTKIAGRSPTHHRLRTPWNDNSEQAGQATKKRAAIVRIHGVLMQLCLLAGPDSLGKSARAAAWVRNIDRSRRRLQRSRQRKG